MFGDDSFRGIEDLFNQLSGRRSDFSEHPRTQSQNILNTIESKKETILIFDLSGEKISSIRIKDNIITNEYGERVHNGQKALVIELESGKILKYNLLNAIAKRKLSHTFSNGILEVSLKKWQTK